LATPWAIAALSEASVFDVEQASMALPTMSSSLRQAPKALVQFFLAAVNMVLRSEMSQVLPLMSTAAIARAASVQSSQEASPLAAIAGFVRLENVSMCISHSEIKVSL